MNRPLPPARIPSFSKRHASFDSPREIPLPSPLSPRDSRELGGKLGYFDLPQERPERDTREDLRREQRERERHSRPNHSKESNFHHSPHSSFDKTHSPSHSVQSSPQPPHSEASFLKPSPLHESSKPLGEPSTKQQIFPHPRPYSLPHSSSSSNSGSNSGGSGGPSPDGVPGVGIPRLHTLDGHLSVGSGSQRDTGIIGHSSTPKPIPHAHESFLGTSAGQSLGKPDRSSSASLPLPAQIPYHTLPRAHLLSTNNSVDGNASGEGSSSSSSGSDESTNTLPSAGTSSPSGAGPSQLFREPPPHSPKTQSSFRQPPPPPPLPPQPHSATFSSYATTPIASFQPPNFSLPSAYPTANKSTLPYLAEDESSQNYMTALRRPIKPPAASHPPVILEEASGSSTASGISRSASTGSSSAHAHAIQGMPGQPSSTTTSQDVWRNPPPVQPPRASPSPRPIGGMVNPSDLPPVLPPQRMRSSVGHGSGSGGGGVLNNATTPTPMSNSFSAPAASGSGANASTSVPLPHTPPNPYSATQTQTLMANSTFHTSSTSASPAYAPFLSPLQPPPERCWIEVETTPMEYKLHIRLEGFKRDGITLATRRRRILHIVADSWDTEGGGHFERRISFGYDADLVGVRAEFDGEWLRVIVPRRIS